MNRGAKFSDCGKYRYLLWRIWDYDLPRLQLVGLNPSTANTEEDDPTIENIIRILKHLGYGGFYMTNLFGLISSNPENLRSCPDPVKDNDYFLKAARAETQEVVFCWGKFPMAVYRAKQIRGYFDEAYCFGKNKDGSPRHPLYLKSENVKLIPL